MGLSGRYSMAFCALVGLVSYSTSGFAGEPAAPPVLQTLQKGKPHDFLFDLSLEGKRGIAVGDPGILLSTEDGGASWKAVSQGVPHTAMLATAMKSGRCLVGGLQGTILQSDDCRTWQKTPAVTDARILALSLNTKGYAVAVGEFGAVMDSIDGGRTWRKISIDWRGMAGLDADPHLYAAHVGEDGSVLIAGEFEVVLKSAGKDLPWTLLHKGTKSIFGLSVPSDRDYLAVGQEGMILRSEDAGKTWKSADSGTQAILTAAWMSPAGAKAVVVGARTVLVSDDRGLTFKQDRSSAATSGIYSAVDGAAPNPSQATAYIVGSMGEIRKLTF